MVSFWPWKGDDSSPASFEKALSTLSVKIADSQANLDRLRATSRRIRVLWMLYLSFAYLIYTIVLVLVVKLKWFGPAEWAGVALGPVLIYTTRYAITTYFNFRIDSVSEQLKQLQEERAKTIKKLKEATRYDSTLQLLEKYGGQPGSAGEPKSKGSFHDGEIRDPNLKEKLQLQYPAAGGPTRSGNDKAPTGNNRVPSRTNIAPPPTANIQRREASPGLPQQGEPHLLGPLNPASEYDDTSAKFAPNAFHEFPPNYAHAGQSSAGPNWYDKVLDLLLGEDETAAKNRIVLICRNCRQVNGQAPPGTRSLAELGVWKCMSCGASNGEDNEGKRLIKEVLEAQAAEADALALAPGEEFKEEDDDDDDDDEEAEGAAMDVGREQVGPEGRSTGRQANAGTRNRRGRH